MGTLISVRRSAFLWAGLLFAPVAFAQPDVIFQTGFEPTETPPYAVGTLAGQNGWGGSTRPVVQTSTVFAGTQAVRFDATGLVSNAKVSHFLTDAFLEDVVVLDIHFMQSTAGTSSFWNPILLFGDAGFMAQLIVQPNGTACLGLANICRGSVPVARGAWHDFQLIIDFSGTATAYVDGTFIASGPYDNPSSTRVSIVDFGVNFAPGTDTAYFDNLSVTNNNYLFTSFFY